MRFNSGSSKGSAALVVVLYAPFAFQSRVGGHNKFTEVARTFSTMMVIVDGMAALQFILQFAGHGVVEAFNLRTLLPQALRQNGRYNTIAYSGSLFRSNGFFLIEPSSLSIMGAFGLICEASLDRGRKTVMALHLAAMAVALSGSGFVVLIVGWILPLIRKAPLRILTGAAVAVPLVQLVAPLTGLSSVTDRVMEFAHPGSSGYARFVAPIAFSMSGWSRHIWALWVGNGPGSILRAIRSSNSLIEIFDPTWAKLLFEYGVLGTIVFLSGLVLWHWGRAGPMPLRWALAYFWLVGGGNLVSPDSVALMIILSSYWPAQRLGAETKLG